MSLSAIGKRVFPVVVWGAGASALIVALSSVLVMLVLERSEAEDWFLLGAPSLLALATQPLFGALVGARAFIATEDDARDAIHAPWLERVVWGWLALLAVPLPAEALRWALMTGFVGPSDRGQSEAWVWLLLSIPVATIAFASGTLFGQMLHRLWLAALAAYASAAVLVLVALMGLGESRFETDALAVAILWGGLFASSAVAFITRGGRVVAGLVLPAVVVSGLAMAGVLASQYGAFLQEVDAVRAARDELSRTLDTSKLTAARLDDFRAELARREEQRRLLREIVPEQLDVPAFMADIEALADARGVRAVQDNVVTNTYDLYEDAVVRVGLDGDKGAIADLRAAVTELTRLAEWRSVTISGQGVTLTIYAMAPSPESPGQDSCPDMSASRVWFGPFASELARERQELVGECDELTKLQPIAEQLRYYQTVRYEIDERQALIDRLRSQ